MYEKSIVVWDPPPIKLHVHKFRPVVSIRKKKKRFIYEWKDIKIKIKKKKF